MLFNYRNFGRLWRVYGRSVLRCSTPKKVINALRTEWAYRRRAIDVRTPPYVLFVEPLYYCNLRCPLCPRETSPLARKGGKGSGPDEAGRLPLEVFDQLLEEIGDYLYQCQIFGLGEPLLDWPRTQEIVRRCRRRRIFTLLSTNSTVITADMARELAATGPDYLIFAIDGVSQEAYEKYRRGGRVELAMAGMRMVVDQVRRRGGRGPALEWQYLVNRFNLHELDQARRIAAELGVFLRVVPMRAGVEKEGQDFWLADDPRWHEDNIPLPRPWRDFHCYWLWRGMVLNSNGQLGRCPGFAHVAQLGDVRDQSIMSLYNGPQSQRARQLYTRGPVPEGDFPWPCTDCPQFDRHHGNEGADIRLTAPASSRALPVLRRL
ncbi:MAG: radical SAM protein [Phycisphaerae bacterium]|nr:radical SAM protein [Tepidisphaeraceae bacterium]